MTENSPSDTPQPRTQATGERRRYRRFKVMWAGQIVISPPAEILILDVSAQGMKLQLPRETALPGRFAVSIPGRGNFVAGLVQLDGRIARVRLTADPQQIATAVADAIPTAIFLEEAS